MFHLSEVDEWLIQRKKLVSHLYLLLLYLAYTPFQCPVCKADVTQPPHGSDPEPVVSHPGEETQPLQPTPTSDATERTPLLSTNSPHDEERV